MRNFIFLLFFGAYLSCASQDESPIIIDCTYENSSDSSATVFILTKGDFTQDTAWKVMMPSTIKTEIHTEKYNNKSHVVFWILRKDEFDLPIQDCEHLIENMGLYKTRLGLYIYDLNTKEMRVMQIDSTGDLIYSIPF